MGTITSHYCLIILGIISPLSHICKIERNNDQWIMKSYNNYKRTSLNIWEENGLAANQTANNLKSWKGQNSSSSRGHFIRNAHGILNMLGWGGLLPVGVIIARNFRKNPLICEEWYKVHVVLQTSGYIIGAIGWGFGLWLGSHKHHHPLQAHRNLGIIIFSFATLQVIAAMWMQPKGEDDYKRWWEVSHKLMGYALIAMIIANIFEGIENQPNEETWRWIYVGLLVIQGIFAVFLEIFRCLLKPTFQRQIMAFDINTFTPSTL